MVSIDPNKVVSSVLTLLQLFTRKTHFFSSIDQPVPIWFAVWEIRTDPALNFQTVVLLFLFTNVLVWEYCYLAQQYENEWELLYLTLSDLPWYNWSLRNRKLLLIFIMNVQDPLAIRSFGSVKVNFENVTVTYQAIYTLIMFYFTVTKNR